jgi:hypothetical protein
MDDYRITHMRWDSAGDHLHPVEVTYRNADGPQETTSADHLPFPVPERVESEAMGGLVRDGICTTCGKRVIAQAS